MAKNNRSLPRISVECPMTYHNVDSPDIKTAVALDVSNHGILFLANEELPEGSLKEVHIEPSDKLQAPINAIIQIVRIEPAAGTSKQYKTAGVIKLLK